MCVYIYLHQAEDNLFVSPCECRMFGLAESGPRPKDVRRVWATIKRKKIEKLKLSLFQDLK